MKEISEQLTNGLFPYLRYAICIILIIAIIISIVLLGRYIHRKIKNKKKKTRWLVFLYFCFSVNNQLKTKNKISKHIKPPFYQL